MEVMTSVPRSVSSHSLLGAKWVSAARQAQAKWAKVSIRHRLAVVRRLRHLIAAHADDLARSVQVSRGSPTAEALAGEVLPLADACRYLEREAENVLRSRRLGARNRPLWLTGVVAEVHREPYGVILIVGPSNYPLFLIGVQAIQALTAGNAVLIKPGLGGEPAVELFVRLCVSAGVPLGLCQALPEDPAAVEGVVNAGVDKVVLTGSASTGERVLAGLAPALVPATMELSGCDAAFVRPGADLDRVVRALRFALLWNSGATCIAPRRVFVRRALAEELEHRLVKALTNVGRSRRWHRDPRAMSLVTDAVTKGARVIVGGTRGDGPIVLADARPDMPLLKSDFFAPVLAIVPVDSDEEALRAAATCPFALGAVVFDEERAARTFADQVRAGVIVVNDVIVPTADPRLPFGGRGRSGFGVTRGMEGLLEMSVPRVVAVRRGQAVHLDEPDFRDDVFVRLYIRAAHGAGWSRRWAARLALAWHLARRLIKGRTQP